MVWSSEHYEARPIAPPDDCGVVPTFPEGGCFAAARIGGVDGVDGAVECVVGWVAEVARGARGGQQQAQPSAMTAGQLRRSPRADASRRCRGMEWMERIPRWFRVGQDELAKRDFGLACT